MNNLGKQIRNELKGTTHSYELPLEVFIKSWFNGKKFTDIALTNKLFDFCDEHALDYIIILGRPQFIRFWLKKPEALLEEGEQTIELEKE